MNNGKLHITCRDIDEVKKTPLMEVVEKFIKKYPMIEGEAYLGYPIYFNQATHEKTCVDMALITKIGVFMFNVLTEKVSDYEEIQNDIFIKVRERFLRIPALREGVDLKFAFYGVTIALTEMEVKSNPLVFDSEGAMSFIDSKKLEMSFSDFEYSGILSAIQQAYGLNTRVHHLNAGVGTKAHKIDKTYYAMESYDHSQMDAILSDSTGIQRIRGMAGSGKTVIIARKAVEIVTAHPEWTVVITYNTRALKEQLVRYVKKFYAERNDGSLYDNEKIQIMQAWGSSSSHGVYYDVCMEHGVQPYNYSEAKLKFGKKKSFSGACETILQSVQDFKKMYDCILIDEAQDFDANFLRLCSLIVGKEKRLVYAYDELQQLNEETMPAPEEIFGEKIINDTPLKVCYRNQSAVIVTAHAIGMGMYREDSELPLQMPSSPDVWQAIGYECATEIIDGNEVTLYRTKETSPELLEEEKPEIIKFLSYDNSTELKQSLIELLRNDLYHEKLHHSDIMIIDMDAIGSVKNQASLMTLMDLEESEGEELATHMAGARNPEDFFREDSIVYTSIYRAKGNETYMIYIINAQRCINSLVPRSDRNALFTAITRSKGWVRVMGYGDEMKNLCSEFEKVKENNFQLVFKHYPTADERKEMILNNRDLDEYTMKGIQDARNKVEKAKVLGKAQSLQLMMEIMGVSTKEELMKIISDGEN